MTAARRQARGGRGSVPGRSGLRGALVLLVGSVALAAGCTTGPGTGDATSGGGPGGETAPGAPSSPTSSDVDPGVDVDLGLPFHLSVPRDVARGMDVTPAQVLTPAADAPPATLTRLWETGGDFSTIASLPIDAERVFGSSTETPRDIASYGAAVLTPSGVHPLTDGSDKGPGGAYYEPQDGSVRGNWVVWRSATLNVGDLSGAGVDDWRIQSADLSGGTVHDLADARGLNGVDTTPATGSDAAPTLNDRTAYFASAVRHGEDWEQMVLGVPLDGSGKVREIVAGTHPAAVDGGVLVVQRTSGASGESGESGASGESRSGDLTAVVLHDEGEPADPTTLFSVVPGSSRWQLRGLWASGPHRVVAVGPGRDGDQGTYLGLWDAPEGGGAAESGPGTGTGGDGSAAQVPMRWIHVASPTVVVSVNATHVAWGSGSQQDPAQMYVMAWGSDEPALLGTAPGYSRPALAPDQPVVLVPVVTESQVSWVVNSLG